MSSNALRWFACVALCLPLAALAGEAPKTSEPPKIVPPTEAEIKAELDKETPEQKKLRVELAELAKAGQKIYFNANGTGSHHIYVCGPDGSGLKQLTDGACSDEYPHCSPDGKQLVFVSSDREKAEQGKALPEALKGAVVDPKFPLGTKDAKWNRYNSRGSDGRGAQNLAAVIWMAGADGAAPKPLAFGVYPHWSPDGKFLAYSVYSRPFPPQLAILDIEKRTEACISHSGLRNCGMPCFSPDGKFVIGSNGAGHCVKLNDDKTAVEGVFVFDGSHPCNGELSRDGKYWAYVVDTAGELGGWLRYREMDYEKPGKKDFKLNLGWDAGSVNYYPDFSPDGKYLVYAHADQQKGVMSWLLKSKQELYVTRFPNCETTVRITWNGAANQHPQWWGPPAK